ncbi:MAG TPA: M20/M25/M40 family metallo-hydrolase [Solirubrobacteraceae bacterium]|nr:M20/M25/M40 family metallo-hydrolase [Solirubrobacteraceae bacterium]
MTLDSADTPPVTASAAVQEPAAHPVVALTRELVAADSTNPQLSPGGAGEERVADIIAARLRTAGLEVSMTEVAPGRPNVVGRLRGEGGGRSLMLCGHMDVVAAEPDGFAPAIRDGRLYGRGTIDMKGGLAAAVIAVERLARSRRPPAGDVLLAGVIDEEWVSAGAERLVAEHHADAAILPEQSDLDVIVEHGGFAWFDVHSRGTESPGIEPDVGVDAIALLSPVLQGLVQLDRELARRPRRRYGRPSVHPSTIAGGTQFPVYAAACTLGIERCLVAGETVADARAEVETLLSRAKAADPRFAAELQLIVGREPLELDESGPLLRALDGAIEARTGRTPAHVGDMGWADSGILDEAGIPCAIFGPAGDGHHTAHEYVEIDSLIACAEILEATARAFCAAESR